MYQKILFLALSLAWKRTESLKAQMKNKHLNNSCIYIIYIFIIYMYNSRLLFVVTFFCYFFLQVIEKLKVKNCSMGETGVLRCLVFPLGWWSSTSETPQAGVADGNL